MLRPQADLLPEALKAAGCDYMAFQAECYFKNIGKNYD